MSIEEFTWSVAATRIAISAKGAGTFPHERIAYLALLNPMVECSAERADLIARSRRSGETQSGAFIFGP